MSTPWSGLFAHHSLESDLNSGVEFRPVGLLMLHPHSTSYLAPRRRKSANLRNCLVTPTMLQYHAVDPRRPGRSSLRKEHGKSALRADWRRLEAPSACRDPGPTQARRILGISCRLDSLPANEIMAAGFWSFPFPGSLRALPTTRCIAISSATVPMCWFLSGLVRNSHEDSGNRRQLSAL